MKMLEKANVIWGVITTFLTAILGQYWFLFLGFLVLNVVDYATGLIKAKLYEKNESSAVGAKGILKKVMYWIVIGIAFFVSDCFIKFGEILGLNLRFLILFGWFTLASYVVNEIRSILENCVVMGINVPEFLIKGLDITQKLINSKTEEEKVGVNNE